MEEIQDTLAHLFSSYRNEPLVKLPQGAAIVFLLPVQLTKYVRRFSSNTMVKDLTTSALLSSVAKKYVVATYMRSNTASHYEQRSKFTCPRPLTFNRPEFLARPSVIMGLEQLRVVLARHVPATFRDIGCSQSLVDYPEDLGPKYDDVNPVQLSDVYYTSSASPSSLNLRGLPVVYPPVRIIIDRAENAMRFVEELTLDHSSPLHSFIPHVAYSVATNQPIRFRIRQRDCKSGLFYRLVHQRYPGTHVWVENEPVHGPGPVLLDGQSFYEGADRQPPPFPKSTPLDIPHPSGRREHYSYTTVTVLPRGVQPEHDHVPALSPTPYVADPYTGQSGMHSTDPAT